MTRATYGEGTGEKKGGLKKHPYPRFPYKHTPKGVLVHTKLWGNMTARPIETVESELL